MSVNQVLKGGGRVVFDPKGSYIQDGGGTKIPLEQKGGLFTLKVWVPRNQNSHFQGQA